MSSMKGKVVVITGAAEGIGRASALKFAKQGASLVLADINEAKLAETRDEIGGDAVATTTDVADENACQAMIDAAVESFGKVDVLLNNAGIAGERGRTGEITTADWRRVMGVNLDGVFFCSRFFFSPPGNIRNFLLSLSLSQFEQQIRQFTPGEKKKAREISSLGSCVWYVRLVF